MERIIWRGVVYKRQGRDLRALECELEDGVFDAPGWGSCGGFTVFVRKRWFGKSAAAGGGGIEPKLSGIFG